MKRLLHYLLLSVTAGLLGSRATAQTPDWNLALHVAGPNPVLVQSVAADSSDNVYLAGSFYDTATFGPYTLRSQGSEDIFVAKWNRSTQRFVWAQRAGGSSEEHVGQLVWHRNALYLTGELRSFEYDFGPIRRRNSSLTANTEAFVAKLTDAGASSTFTWVHPIGTGNAKGTALATDGDRLYVAGTYDGPLSFATFTLPNAGWHDTFVAAVDDQGPSASVAWAEQAGGPFDDCPRSLAVANHQVYVAGYFISPAAHFGASELLRDSPEYFASDAFVAKLQDDGARGRFVWAKGTGGWFNDQFSGVAVRGANVYVTGYIGTAAAFGPLQARTAGTLDMVVAKLVDTGSNAEFQWVQTAGGAGYEEAKNIAVRGSSLYISGEISSTDARFGNLRYQRETGATGAFITKLTDLGSTSNFDWVRVAHGVTNAFVHGFALSGNRLLLSTTLPPSAGLGNLPPTAFDTPQSMLLGLTDKGTPVSAADSSPLEVFPNPATRALWVRMPAAGASRAQLQILDPLGRVVFQRTDAVPESGLQSQVFVDGLASGSYLLRVQAGKASMAKRFVVTR